MGVTLVELFTNQRFWDTKMYAGPKVTIIFTELIVLETWEISDSNASWARRLHWKI